MGPHPILLGIFLTFVWLLMGKMGAIGTLSMWEILQEDILNRLYAPKDKTTKIVYYTLLPLGLFSAALAVGLMFFIAFFAVGLYIKRNGRWSWIMNALLFVPRTIVALIRYEGK